METENNEQHVLGIRTQATPWGNRCEASGLHWHEFESKLLTSAVDSCISLGDERRRETHL